MNFYQKILIGIFGISLVLFPETIVTSANEYQIVQALSSQEVNLRAKQVTVKIDGDNFGSGIIIAASDNVYTILTNWHVVKDSGNYLVQTVDGRKHQVQPETIQRLLDVDLAILQFTSQQNYQIAELGNSENLIEGQNIYFAGYPGELRTESDRFYRFFSANIVGLLAAPNANGYSLVYDGSAFPGMSGGPVFNDRGLVIGIHGETNIHAVTGAVSNYAIPSSIYQAAISAMKDDNSSQETATSESDTSENPPTSSNNPPETTPTEENVAAIPETIVETKTNSVPVLNSPQTETENSQVVTSNDDNQPSEIESTNITTDFPEIPSESIVNLPDEQINNLENNIIIPNNQDESNQANSMSRRPVNIISPQTGIDYTNLQNLLSQKKWLEADRQTKKTISNVFETIKRKNNTSFIELRTLADRACNDIYTIDFLWRKFSGDRYGLQLQQNIWNDLNKEGNFSITVWRSFATEIGWKEGDINSAEGYILYEKLNFEPQSAPQGHLPWWFDYSEEQKNTMRQVLTRCNLQDTVMMNND